MTSSTALPEELLAEVPTGLADLQRRDGSYAIQVIYLPDLSNPETAQITIRDSRGKTLDTLHADDLKIAWEMFHHPSGYSERLCDYLNGVAPVATT